MLEQELKNIWQSSAKAEQIKFDLSRLLIELNTEMKNIEQAVIARDRREIIAAVLGIFIFSYFAYEIPFPITKAACLFAVAWLVFIIYHLRNARKKTVSDTLYLPFSTQLQEQKKFLLRQKNLLDTVLYWYILPPFVMNIVFILGLGDPSVYDWSPKLLDLLPLTHDEKVKTIIILAIFYTITWWINRSTVKRYYLPAIEKVEQAQKWL